MIFKNLVSVSVAVFVIVLCIDQGLALKCWDCNSTFDSNCADTFKNITIGLVSDCGSQYNLNQKQQCRKIKHKLNGNWQYIRGCNTPNLEHLHLKEAEVHLCNLDACNSAGVFAPVTVIAALATPVLMMQFSNLF